MSGFFEGDLLIIKQAANLIGYDRPSASIFVADEPKMALCLGKDEERNTLKILMGNKKWLVKPKDCAHYNNFTILRRKNEQNSD